MDRRPTARHAAARAAVRALPRGRHLRQIAAGSRNRRRASGRVVAPALMRRQLADDGETFGPLSGNRLRRNTAETCARRPTALGATARAFGVERRPGDDEELRRDGPRRDRMGEKRAPRSSSGSLRTSWPRKERWRWWPRLERTSSALKRSGRSDGAGATRARRLARCRSESDEGGCRAAGGFGRSGGD